MKIDLNNLADESGTTFAPFNASTLPDAVSVVKDAFGFDAREYLGKMLRNPVLAEAKVDNCGDVVYLDGKPVGFEAAIVRRLYWGKKMLWGVCGSTMGLKKGTSPLVLLSLMKRNLAPRGGSVLWFANTANATSVRMNRKLGVRGRGPTSWTEMRYAVIHPLVFAKMMFFRKVLHKSRWATPIVGRTVCEERILCRNACEVRRLMNIEPQTFEDFWRDYLVNNHGLVTSRSAAELEWIFGEGVRSGRIILLGAISNGRLVGYLVMASNADGWWRVQDLMAFDNESWILSLLFSAAKRFLRKRTSAPILFMGGFPPSADAVVRTALPYRRFRGGNPFLWHFTDESFAMEQGDLSQLGSGWFFGPYDGDSCL